MVQPDNFGPTGGFDTIMCAVDCMEPGVVRALGQDTAALLAGGCMDATRAIPAGSMRSVFFMTLMTAVART